MGRPSRRFLLGLMVFGLEVATASVSEADLALSTPDTVGKSSLRRQPGDQLHAHWQLDDRFPRGLRQRRGWFLRDHFGGPLPPELRLQRFPRGSALASETFTGHQGVLVGGFRYLDLSSAVTLGPGTYQLDAVGFSSSDLNGNSTLSGFSVSPNSFGGVLAIDGYAYNDLTMLNPLSGNVASPVVFGAGNFSTTPLSVPEPPSIVLGSLGVLGGLVIRCLGNLRIRAALRVAR